MGAIQKLLGPVKNERQFSKFFLIPLDAATGERLRDVREGDLPSMHLQYWPETLSYNRGSIGWEEQSIPGSSHPLQSWTGNGAPTLTVEAVFTEDVDPGYVPPGSPLNNITAGNADMKSYLDPNRSFNQSVNINSAIAWLTACSNPVYADVSTTTSENPVAPPPVIQIVPEFKGSESLFSDEFGATEIAGVETSASTRSVTLSQLAHRDFYGIMSDLSVNYQSFFPSGAPRIATASITFKEVIQIGGVIIPHNRMENVKIAKHYRFTGVKPRETGNVG